MEPDVIRMYSSSPPPMEDSVEEEDEEFGDFDTFSAVPNSISFTEFDTPTTFNQSQALTATSPPELLNSRGLMGFSHSSSNGTHSPGNDGIVSVSHQDSCPSERTEMKKVFSSSSDLSVSNTAAGKPADCNGGGAEVLTNGFATFDIQESPSSVEPVHSDVKGVDTEDKDSLPVCSTVDSFADFAAFSGAEGRHNHNQSANVDQSTGDGRHCMTEQSLSSEDTVRDTNRTQSNTSSSDSRSGPRSGPSEASAWGNGTDAGSPQRFAACVEERSAPETVCVDSGLTLNGLDSESALSPDAAADSEAEQLDGKVSGNETETETETSFGQPLSTDALEEYGDVSTTGSVPSPPFQGDPSTPADHSQLAEDEDEEDFGDFGDAGSISGQGFAGFEQLEAQDVTVTEEDEFGDFNTPRFIRSGCEEQDGDRVAEFPVSESFGNFSSAVEGEEADAGWSAFGEQQQGEGESWAAFSTEQGAVPHDESREEEEKEEVEEEWHESEAPAVSEEPDRELVLLSSRLQKLFQISFPQNATITSVEDKVVSLKVLLEPQEYQTQPGAEEGKRSSCDRSVHGDVWTQLQDIHDALGLRYQWGGSHCNKVLLCCLGIDTRNILFTGQKKQPVIVPMYAASLGMLEPTKEPVKPVSAAEMIASIAQTLPPAPDSSSCPSDSVQQEALPPIQFDWSSSGLTNPLDASGGSSLLNLDFFGPVEDSGSTSSTSIPGVDPELYELTTAKLEPGSSGSRVADAFARLMSTMEKTSTSTRKPRKDENLSEEAAKVIAGLPDLTFMQAKVLMFPATLTPLNSQAASD